MIEQVNAVPPDDGRQSIRASPRRILIEFLPGDLTNLDIQLNGVSPVMALGWLVTVQGVVLGIQDQMMKQQLLQHADKTVTLASGMPPSASKFPKRG
jgi:hypothetical protein